MEQKPSIGRIVRVADEHGSQLPAIITEVHDEVTITATVFKTDGTTEKRDILNKTPNPPMGEKDWNWPPRD